MARKWRKERDQAFLELETAQLEIDNLRQSAAEDITAELSRVWALARKWRAERDHLRAAAE